MALFERQEVRGNNRQPQVCGTCVYREKKTEDGSNLWATSDDAILWYKANRRAYFQLILNDILRNTTCPPPGLACRFLWPCNMVPVYIEGGAVAKQQPNGHDRFEVYMIIGFSLKCIEGRPVRPPGAFGLPDFEQYHEDTPDPPIPPVEPPSPTTSDSEQENSENQQSLHHCENITVPWQESEQTLLQDHENLNEPIRIKITDVTGIKFQEIKTREIITKKQDKE